MVIVHLAIGFPSNRWKEIAGLLKSLATWYADGLNLHICIPSCQRSQSAQAFMHWQCFTLSDNMPYLWLKDLLSRTLHPVCSDRSYFGCSQKLDPAFKKIFRLTKISE